jgi:acyl dehydratase
VVTELQYDRSLYGKEHRAGPFEVTREIIRKFSHSIGETNPIYTDEVAAQAAGFRSLVAPPTLCTIFVRRVELPDIGLKFGKMRFHAGQRVQPRGPIVAGDFISASSHLKDVYAKTGRTGTMVFIVWETTFHNQKGEVVADIQESFATRE